MINYETIVQPQEFTVEQVFNNNEYLIPTIMVFLDGL